MSIDKKHLLTLQGKEYVTFPGLLDHAHGMGLRSIETALVQIPTPENQQTAIMQAIVTFRAEDGPVTWSAYGDASPRNVNRGIAEAIIRMAETRSIARALRMATNVGVTAFEELPGEPHEDAQAASQSPPQRAQASLPPESRGDAAAQGFERRELSVERPESAVGRSTLNAQPSTSPVGPQAGPDNRPACTAKGCGKIITPDLAKRSLEEFGRKLCHEHIALARERGLAKKIETAPTE